MIKSKFNLLVNIFRDVIVKFTKIQHAKAAYEELKTSQKVLYVPTKHNSEDFSNFSYLRTETYDRDAKDATFTLNMFKIKQSDFLEAGQNTE